MKLIKRINLWLYQYLEFFVNIFVDIYLGDKLRGYFYRCYMHNCGRFFKIGCNSHIEEPQNIVLGRNVSIGRNAWISGGGGLVIGDNSLIGPNVFIHSANHLYSKKNVLIKKQGHEFAKIIIGKDVWIAGNVTILPGVVIEDGAVIAAGTVLTKNVPAYCVYAGVPGRFIKERK